VPPKNRYILDLPFSIRVTHNYTNRKRILKSD
jgi:hypothetical protein